MLHKSEQIYRFLVGLYPARYQQEFGEEMQYVFAELLKDANTAAGGRGIMVLWIRTMLDAGKSLVIQHLEDQEGIDAMKAKMTHLLVQNKNILWIALATALILLLPWTAMQFVDGVHWSVFDFVFAGTLLFGAGLTFDLIARRAKTPVYRVAVGAAVFTALLLVWVNLAVGIIGSEDHPANAMYLGVLVIGGLGTLIARLRPHGMVRALCATAAAQALVTLVALVIAPEQPVIQLVLINGFFCALWAGSAWLFGRANTAQTQQPG